MEFVQDIKWSPEAKVSELVDSFKTLGFQSINLAKASEILYKMWKEKAKVVLSFTSNMGTSGLRGFFAQLIELGLVDVVVTTAGSVEEDIMKSMGEKFLIYRFTADDIELHERGMNRVGNLIITNDSYARFEGAMKKFLDEVLEKRKRWSGVELLWEIGKKLKPDSFLYQAAKRRVPVFCPAITDGAIGFHLYLAKERHPDFVLDTIDDFKQLIFSLSPEDRKGLIALGGGVSKHFALLATMINGGADYAVYMTTSAGWSGSMSGASTNEAKSWGKIRDDSDSITVMGDVTINFPLAAFRALDMLYKEGVVKWQGSS